MVTSCVVGTANLYLGDCLSVMAELDAASIDAVVCDPPYGLEFMGKGWDRGVPGVAYWEQALRVLKPGGHLLSFAGTRTYHRMAAAIEDAGFEIRDQIQWLYGSGFPKSLDVSKAIDKAAGVEREVVSEGKAVKRMIPGADQNSSGSWIKDNGREFVPTVTAPATPEAEQWDGWGTALKPANEPIVVARKPIEGTVAANVLKHGTGAINVDACRVATDDSTARTQNDGPQWSGKYLGGRRINGGDSSGRWPANVIHDGSDEVLALFPESSSGANPTRRGSDKFRGVYSEFEGQAECVAHRGADSGSAARFFYCAKADTEDREVGNTHPTVKPKALMRYLVRLVTPPGGIVLDPFGGSMTTGVAAILEGFRSVVIEREPEYFAIGEGRIRRAWRDQKSLLFPAHAG